VIIDEVQHRPGLFPEIRGIINDGKRKNLGNGRFLFLGSASHELLKQSGESLAGRIAYHEMTPFRFHEVDKKEGEKLWVRGGFPDSFLAPNEDISLKWREQFINTYLTKNLNFLDKSYSLPLLKNLLQMTAHLHSQFVHIEDLMKSTSLSRAKVKDYLEIFEQSYLLRQLQPYFSNIKKRLVKTPKIYIRDTGLLHSLLTSRTEKLSWVTIKRVLVGKVLSLNKLLQHCQAGILIFTRLLTVLKLIFSW